jgi:hypothetical protein
VAPSSCKHRSRHAGDSSRSPAYGRNQSSRDGGFGNVDRLVVVRNGFLVLDERFPTDYRSISRGRTGALGCGVDACMPLLSFGAQVPGVLGPFLDALLTAGGVAPSAGR